MRKITAAILVAMIVLLSMPGMAAAAGGTAKQDFIKYNTEYYAQSMQLQKTIFEAMNTKTFHLDADANLREFQMVQDNGPTISNIPGNGSVTLDFNLAQGKGAAHFQGSLLENRVQGQIYFSGDNIIITRETILSLNSAGADFSELGDLSQLPAYIVFPLGMDEADKSLLGTAWTQSIDYQEQQMAIAQDLMVEILEIIPDHCYSYSGEFAVLDLTQITRDPGQLLTNLKDHSVSLSDKLAAILFSNPVMENDPNVQYRISQSKNDMVTAINSLTLADLNEFQKNMPINLKQAKVYASPDRFKATMDLSGTFSGFEFSFAFQQDTRSNPDKINTRQTAQLSIQTPEFNLGMDLVADGSTDFNKATAKMTLSGQGQEKKDMDAVNQASGVLDLNMNIDWSGQNAVSIPQINAQNSKTLPLHQDRAIQVYLNGQKIPLYGTNPIVSNGRTMLPAALLADALGGSASWQPPDTVTLSNGVDNMVMRMGSTNYSIGGQQYTMDAAPFIQDGRTYVPVRVIAEYFNLSVIWDPDSRIVFLNSVPAV